MLMEDGLHCIDTFLFGKICDNCHGSAIFELVGNILSIVTAGVLILATIGFIIAGVMILTAHDNSSIIAKAKSRMLQIIIGIVAFALMSIITDFIIPGGVVTVAETGDCPVLDPLPEPTNPPGDENIDMASLIGKTAATMSWPIQSWQNGFDPFFDPSADGTGKVKYGTRQQNSYGGPTTIGKCWYQGGREWITQTRSAGSKHLCANTNDGGAIRGRITYDVFNITPNNAFAGGNAYASCDRFVSTVLFSLKLGTDSAGNNFPYTGPSGMHKWLEKSPDWTEIENKGTLDNLKPGDIFAADANNGVYGHVAIYVGEYGYSDGTKTYNLAEASSGGRYPRLTEFLSSSYNCSNIGKFCTGNRNQPYHIFRYTGAGSKVKNPWKYSFKKVGEAWTQKSGEEADSEDEDQPQRQPGGFEAKSNVFMTATELGAGDLGSIKGAIVHVPENATTNMPLLVFLRGTVCQSNPCDSVKTLNVDSLKRTMSNMPPIQQMNSSATYASKIIAISPVINNNNYNGGTLFANLKALIDATANKYSIDKGHIYIYGYSLGGAHTWCMVDQYPQYFKAAAVISMNVRNGCVGGVEPRASQFSHTKVKGFVGKDEKNRDSMQGFLNTIGGDLIIKNSLHERMLQNIDFDSEVFNWFMIENN